MSVHPYENLPDHAFWRKSVADIPGPLIDPIVAPAFQIGRDDLVATAGSCFAQHIARHLKASGFKYFVSEKAHPLMPLAAAEAYQYGTYTARYGNVYTARQLCQLFKRAYGMLVPEDVAWQRVDGKWVDPFRPQIQPGGYDTQAEMEADRAYHLSCVRNAFEELDVFIFTLGLTETWMSRVDDVVFPICPGVVGGTFDAERYVFRNFRASEVTQDLIGFAQQLRTVNPTAKIMVTVSPVPLIATAAGHHVLVATTYSKSALRVACEEFVEAVDGTAYIPSYEIITGSHAKGAYFASDLRSVTDEGVDHVMRLVLKHYAGIEATGPGMLLANASASTAEVASSDAHLTEMKKMASVICDEEALDPT